MTRLVRLLVGSFVPFSLGLWLAWLLGSWLLLQLVVTWVFYSIHSLVGLLVGFLSYCVRLMACVFYPSRVDRATVEVKLRLKCYSSSTSAPISHEGGTPHIPSPEWADHATFPTKKCLRFMVAKLVMLRYSYRLL